MTKELDQTIEQNIIHTFLNYEVNPSLREIHQVKNPLKVSKKSFDILILLIEKQGQIVSKQEITARVWPNQIVTDATLNKQITRLRNDLVNDQPTDQVIIETVRGVGIRLIPTVKSKSIKQKGQSKWLIWLILVLIVSALFLYLGPYSNKPDTTNALAETESIGDSYNIVLVPSKNSGDWLNVGGMDYLSTQLQQHPAIQTISPKTEWSTQDDPHSLAIEVSQYDGVDYVLVVNNQIDGKSYMTDLALRSRDGILAKTTIDAGSISGLFDKINSWVMRELQISATVDSGQMDSYKTTDFVLESYLRGREVAIHKSYEKALQLFQTAANQDADFLPAWIALAEVEARLGNNEKALALVDTVSKRSLFNQDSMNKIFVHKANFSVGLNKLDEAIVFLNKAIKLSEQKNDIPTLIDAITIKIKMYFNSGLINEDTINLSLRQISLLGEYRPDPYLLALAHYNLTTSYHQLGQTDLAINSISRSIALYTKENNIRGIVISTSLLARIYKDMGDTGRALMSLEKIEGLPEQIDGLDEQQIYWQYKAENQIYHGLRNEALISIEKLQILSQQSASFEPKIIALSLSFELNVIYKKYDEAKINVKQMLIILRAEKQGYPPIFNDLILAYEMFVAALSEQPSTARLIVERNLKSNPDIKSFFEAELRMIEAIILVNEGETMTALEIYHDLLEGYIEDNNIQDALYYAGYPILELQWQNDMQDYVKTMNYLNEIAVFKYPIFKYKAQYLAHNKDYISAYAMMEDLKNKANQFWTTEDQLQLEQYQGLSQRQ